MGNLEIVYLRTDELLPYARNARKHSVKQVGQIAASIIEFGFLNPVIIDRNKTIVAGHGRVMAAQQIGLEKIPVVRAEHLTDAQRRAYTLVDNQLALNSSYDDELLKIEISELKDFDFDLDLLGFDNLDDLMPQPENEGNTDPDDIPEVPQNIHGVKRGDIWQLGEHRLMCGDSTSKDDVEKLMNGEKADMVFTDPPYNHASEEKLVSQSVRQAMKKLSESEWDKNFSFSEVGENIEKIRAENCTVYICTSWHLAGQIWEWMAKHSNHYSYCVWHKPNPMPSLMKRHWTWSTELICYATFGKHTFNFPENGHASNVWSINKNHKNDLHPTMKPTAIPEMAITHSSKQNNIVADLFLGSGSTLIACEKTGRKCVGMELDEHYCSVIIERWQNFTGRKAEKIA